MRRWSLKNLVGLVLVLCIHDACADAKAAKKPLTPILFDTYETEPKNGYWFDNQPKSGYIFPSPQFKLILRRSNGSSSAAPPFALSPQSLMSPEQVMMGTISELTHGAFSRPTPLPTLHRLSSGADGSTKEISPPYGTKTTPSPKEIQTPSSSSESKEAFNPSSIKIGGHIGHNLKSLPKPIPIDNYSRQIEFDQTLSQLQVSGSENRGTRMIKSVITAEDLGGNRPTLTPFHFTSTIPPPVTTTTAQLLPLPSPPIISRARANRHREGNKVKSPHNRVFAPTQNPIGIAHNEGGDSFQDDFTKFRAALSKFGSRVTNPTTLAYESPDRPNLPPLPPPFTTTTQQAIIIQRAKIISPPETSSTVTDSTNGNDEEEELPFYTESGGVFDQNTPGRESVVDDLHPAVNYVRKPPARDTRPSPVDYARDPYYESLPQGIDSPPVVTNRPLSALASEDPRNYDLPRSYLHARPSPRDPYLEQYNDADVGGFPQNHQRYQPFQNNPNHKINPPATAEYHYFQPPHETKRPRPQAPPRINPYDYNTYSKRPFTTTTTTDRTIHFSKKPPPRYDPASDYFYGDPRPPPPTAPPKTPQPDIDEKQEQQDESEEEVEEDEEPREKNRTPGVKSPSKDTRDEDEEGYDEEVENERPRPPPRPQQRNKETPDDRRNHDGNGYFHPPLQRNNFYTPRRHNEARNNFRPFSGNENKPFRPSQPFPFREPSEQAGFGFGNSNQGGRCSFDRRRPEYATGTPGRIGEFKTKGNTHGEFDTPGYPNLDPIYTMSIKDYDAELKRRENQHRPVQNQQRRPEGNGNFQHGPFTTDQRSKYSKPERHKNIRNEEDNGYDEAEPPPPEDYEQYNDEKGGEDHEGYQDEQEQLQQNGKKDSEEEHHEH